MIINALCLFFLTYILQTLVFSWNEDITHRDLSQSAAANSVLSRSKGDYMKNLGLEKGLNQKVMGAGKMQSVMLWLQDGAQLEDTGTKRDALTGKARFNNHFHNPLKPWSQAGLDDWVGLHYTGESSLLWAQDGNKQQSIVEYRGDWSWQKTRDYFYDALISISDTLRQENFAKTFRGLGHQMHLLQDTAVPDHVRNDAHPEDALFGKRIIGNPYFESWVKNERQKIIDLATTPVFPNVSLDAPYNGLAPVTQLFDADTYDGLNASAGINQGLSEYANTNFFSNDTLFAAEIYPASDRHYFPYPKKTSTDIQSYIDQIKSLTFETAEDGIEDKGIWIKKERDGESIINHFVRAGRWTSRIYNQSGTSTTFYKSFYRDEKCHEDYAARLIPRAVGYSAKLLDYFFRGSIEITVPISAPPSSNGVYSMIDATQAGFNPATTKFTTIKLRAKNTTSTNEDMTNGTIELVVKYKTALADPFHGGPVATSADFSYAVVPEKNGISSLSRTAYTELNFDLGQKSIPLWATDVYLQVVYHGKLGNEDGAVAVGFKDINEPTPVDMFNNMDKICINGSWHEAGSPEAIDQVDTNPKDGIADEADVYAHNLNNIYLRFSPHSEVPPYYWASPSIHDFTVPYLTAGAPVRAVYILSDDMVNIGHYMSWVTTDPDDQWIYNDFNRLWWFYTVKRQTDYSEDSGLCGGSPPCYIDVYPEHLDVFPSEITPAFFTFRNTSMWGGSVKILENSPYPDGSTCSYDLL